MSKRGMTAKPFAPGMEHDRKMHGAWWAALLFIVVTCSAWGGQHGLGSWIGRAVALAALAALGVVVVCAVAWFAGWAVRAVRHELDR